MKNLFFPLLFLSLFFFAKEAGEYSLNLERSPARVVDCLELAQNFLGEARPRLAIPKNSLLGKYPSLVDELDKLEFVPFSLPDFYNSFLKKNKRAPTLREAMEAMYVERRELISKYDEVIADVEALQSPDLESFIGELKFSKDKLNKFKDLDHYDDELVTAFNDGKSKFSSIDEPIVLKNGAVEQRFLTYIKERSREGNFNGEMGELTGYAASKDKPVKKGLKFETRSLKDPIPYQVTIDTASTNLETTLAKKTDKQLITLVNKYGEGILRNAKSYLDNLGERPLDRDILIGKIIVMIRTKEIDLVFQKTNGKYIWAEVKTYKKPITMETLNGGGYKLKPMSDQLLEHKALRDLLGFTETVDLRFISPTSKVEPDAKAYIESLGYDVISAK